MLSRLKYIIKLILASLGIIAGFSAAIVFSAYYKSYGTAIYAFYSGIFAMVTMLLFILENKTLNIMWINVIASLNNLGIAGFFTSLISALLYTILGIYYKQNIMHFKGENFYMMLIWSLITSKWAYSSFWYSRKILKLLNIYIPVLNIYGDDETFGYDEINART